MVKALNGNIRVESELGVGSKFIIELPFNQEFAQKASQNKKRRLFGRLFLILYF